MTEAIDFTSCERLPGRAYNGANGKKIAVRYARIAPRIDLVSINAFIDALPLLTDLQQLFYKTYIAARHTILFDQKGIK